MHTSIAEKSCAKSEFIGKYFQRLFCQEREDLIGIEFEFPILSLNGSLWSPQIIDGLNQFIQSRLNFEIEIAAAGIPIAFRHPQRGDKISYEVTHSTLEFSLSPQPTIVMLERRFQDYFFPLQSFLLKSGVFLGCTGLHPLPYHRLFTALPQPHYLNIEGYLKKYPGNRHPDYQRPHVLMIGSQTHLQIPFEQLHQHLNIYHGLGWLESLLFANSFKQLADHSTCCYRDLLLRNSGFGANPKNVNYPDRWFKSNSDFFKYFLEKSIFTKRSAGAFEYFSPIKLKYLDVSPKVFSSQGKSVKLSLGNLNDCLIFNPVKLTPYGTLEMRSCCQQPLADLFAPAAFSLAIREALPILIDLVPPIWVAQAEHFRGKINICHFNIFQHTHFIYKIIDLLSDCLSKRNHGEERYLLPLFARLEGRINPALRVKKKLQKGHTITSIILKDSLPS